MRIYRFAIATLIAGMSLCLQASAQTGAPAEPEYVNQFFVLGSNGQLTPLEPEPIHHIAKRKNIPFIKAEIEGRADLDGGPASPVHVGPSAHFVVKMMTGAIDPATMMHLIQLKADKQGRYYVTSDYKGYVYTNGKSSGPQGDAAQLKITKYGQGSLEVETTQPLPAGEYAFITSGVTADCFSVDPSISSTIPAQTPAKADPPPLLTWVPKPIADPAAHMTGAEARIAGTAEAGPLKGPARLIMSCQTRLFDTGPQSTATATIEVHPNLVDFDTDAIEDIAMVDNGDARSQLGSQPPMTLDAGYMGKSPNGNPLLMIEYGWTTLKQIVDTPGTILTASVMAPENKGHASIAHFSLPADAAPLQAMMAPCFDSFKAEEEKAAAARLVFCPDIASLSLTSADVLAGASEKKLPVDPDDDTGSSYPLPKSTKAHPRPALKLACHYSPAAGRSASAQTIRKLPIPAKATICTINDRSTSNAATASCQ